MLNFACLSTLGVVASLLALQTPACQSFEVASPSPNHPQQDTQAAGQEPKLEFSLQSWRFSAKTHALCIIDNPRPEWNDLPQHMQKHHCVAGINGGFFDKDFEAVGLVLINGKKISALNNTSKLVSGVLASDGKRITLMRRANWEAYAKKNPQVKYALQSGPFLIENGRRVEGLHKQRIARRSFIARDADNNWLIGVSSAVSLHDLARILADSKNLGGFKVQSALNLDGGSSCAFYNGGLKLHNAKPVRNYIGIYRK